MPKHDIPEPEGFRPIEVQPYVDKAWRPIELATPSPAAPVVEIEKPAAGEKEH